MLLYKFGGAALKNSQRIKNAVNIILENTEQKFVVVSASDKTTNLLEEIVEKHYTNDPKRFNILNKIIEHHNTIISELFENDSSILNQANTIYYELHTLLNSKPSYNYDFEYSRFVAFGELLSSFIVSSYIKKFKNCELVDIRNYIKTKENYTEAIVDWNLTKEQFRHFNSNSISITQGFIASNSKNETTTLGREGSDFSASILANVLNANKVIIWKDVAGILNADPDYFKETKKIDYINYTNAIELAFLGARVIHPKTIKPLESKNIPLEVKSFINPNHQGTLITSSKESFFPPNYILKKNQIYIKLSPKDYNFIPENNVSKVFELFHTFKYKVNFIDFSAQYLTFCVDNKKDIQDFIVNLKKSFKVNFSLNKELLTIYKYNQNAVNEILKKEDIIIKQENASTAKFIY